MAYSFDQIFAADPANPSNVAANAAITIYQPGDPTKSPLVITDPSGGALSNPITVNANGFGSAFMHATMDRVAWDGGGFTGFFTSYEGIKNEAVDARTAAQEAAATAGADAAAVATAAIGTATDDAQIAASSATAAADSAAASATAAADAAALVNAPADTAIAAAINGTGTATKTALDTTYAPASVAATKLDKTEAATAYVPNNALAAESIRTSDAKALTPWRAALANRDNEAARILFVGDSRTEGEGATTVAKRWQDRLAVALRDRFKVTGGNPAYAPRNYVPVQYVSPTLAGQSLWSTPAGGTFFVINNFGLGTRVVDLRTSAATTLSFTGTSAKIAYVKTAAAGSFTYAVDGGSATTVSWAAGSSQDGQLVAIGPLTAGAHTVTVTGVTGSSYICGAYIYNGEETKGIQVFDAGHHGVTSNTVIGSGTFYYTQTVANVNPHCVYIGIGTNDYGGNVLPATFKTRMQTLITAIKAGCTLTPTIIIAVDSARGGSFTYPWSQYVTVLRELVAEAPTTTTLLDLSLRMPVMTDNSLALYKTDLVHEADKGHAFRADILAGFLSPS